MGRKKKGTKSTIKRNFPFKVRLMKSKINKGMIVHNDVVLYSDKDVLVEDEKTFFKIADLLKYLEIIEVEK